MSIFEIDKEYVANTYARFPLQIVEGKGSIVKDENGKEYIDLGTGIAVNGLGVADEGWKNAVIEQLGGEKIDIIPWSEDPLEFIAKALAPAKVLRVTAIDEKSARVVVPDDKLSLAIGRDGQNARLAARLTGWKIDVKSESKAQEELANEEFDGDFGDVTEVPSIEEIEGLE